MTRARALLLGLCCLCACSRVDLGWRLAPWFLEREGARWLGLHGKDKAAFGREARAWLERDALGLIRDMGALGRSLAAALDEGRDAAVLSAIFDDMPRRWDRALEPTLPSLAKWLAVEPAQRAVALERAFVRSNAADDEDWAGASAQGEARLKRMRARLKEWIGPLSPAQNAGLAAWAAAALYPVDAWKADRGRRQAALLAALRQGAGAPALQAQLRRWWVEPEQDREPAFQAALSTYRAQLRQGSATLLASLSPAQRRQLRQKLAVLAEDLVELAAEADKSI